MLPGVRPDGSTHTHDHSDPAAMTGDAPRLHLGRWMSDWCAFHGVWTENLDGIRSVARVCPPARCASSRCLR